ncbi:hypothetical protein Pmani_013312 [Petrolisthes manimaculis]|uniref:Uncharacterized protein n=1 Tax=Petrolisthes manimaculis TaxID=1843537 RepID=A0AAE1UDQ3_9EUCA|nr:hypothetical protein Pmani_013312 [Petrolisthes manimaculis]
MRERNLRMMGICETRMRKNEDTIIHGGYRPINSGIDTGRHGVGFVLAPELERCVEVVKQVNDRIVGVSLKMKEVGVTVIQIYAPQQGRATAEKDGFYEKLQETVDGAI